jgi:hypothetical protein
MRITSSDFSLKLNPGVCRYKAVSGTYMELLQVSLQVPSFTQLQHSRKCGVVNLLTQAH